jgi:hypothetical protein
MAEKRILSGKTPLDLRSCKTEAERLKDVYLATFQQAPEAQAVLYKQYFSIYPFEKEALQNDVIQIVRRDFIWDFKYTIIGEDRLIGLKRQPAGLSLATHKDRELVEVTTRRFYKVDEPGGTIHYRQHETSGTSVTQINTREAVLLAEQLLAAFRADASC